MATAANPFFVNAGSTADQKAADYSRLLSSGMSDTQIRDAANNFFGQQTDADWSYLQNLAQQPTSAPSGQVPYQSALIESLRGASPGFTSNNPGVTMLANPANSKTVIDFKRAPPPAPFFPPGPPVGPPLPPAPTPAPAPPPSGGGGGGGGSVTPGPIVIGPNPGLGSVQNRDDPVFPGPDDPVLPGPDDFVRPPDPDPPPPDDGVADPFPVSDPPPLDAVDLPPLLPDDLQDPPPDAPRDPDSAPPPLVPDRVELPDYTDDLGTPIDLDPRDPGPREADPDPDVPDYTDDLGTPIYDEIPEGEIDVKTGVTDAYKDARDALVNADTVTQLDDPLDELGDIDLEEVLLDVPPVPVPDSSGDGSGSSGGVGDVYVRPSVPVGSVSDNPLDEWEWIEPDVPEIPLPEIPSASMDYNFSDADLMDFLFGDCGGGGGGGLGGMNLYMQE